MLRSGRGEGVRWLLPVAAAALLAIAGLVILWLFLEPVAIRLRVPEQERLDIVRMYLLAVGGGLLIWQIAVASRRASSAERVAELTELGNITERLNTAVANLGNDSPVVSIGALYQLHHIARDAADYRGTVYGLLSAHWAGISDSVSDTAQLAGQLAAEYDTVSRMIGEMDEFRGVFYEEEKNEENGR